MGTVWSTVSEEFDISSHQRQGEGHRGRPILVTAKAKRDRDAMLAKNKRLGDAGTHYECVFIHPDIRNGWKMLQDAKAPEKAQPESVGCHPPRHKREKTTR